MRLNLKDRVPAYYNRAQLVEIISQLERQINELSEGRASAYHGVLSEAELPTSGNYVRGDWVKNRLPSPSGYFGFIVVESSPLTWKGFGLIQA